MKLKSTLLIVLALCSAVWAQKPKLSRDTQGVLPLSRVTGAIDIREYGAKCDGVTDDTAAFLAASTAAFTSINPAALFIPATGHECVISQWNLTNHFGQQGGSPLGSIHVVGQSGDFGGQSTIRCKEASANTGICIDLSGSDQVTLEGLRILGGTGASDAPKVVILTARTTTDLGYSNGFYFRDLDVETYGKFNWYSYGGEEVHWIDSRFVYNGAASSNGEADILISNINTRAITSPFKTLVTGDVSMTQVMFDDGTIIGCGNLTGACIELDNAATSPLGGIDDIKIYGYANLGSDAARPFLKDLLTGEIHNLKLENRVEAANSGDILLTLGSASIKGLKLLGTFAMASVPSNPIVAFTNASGSVGEGSIVDIQPSDRQENYPATVVSCASTNIFGLVIYNRNAAGGINTGVSCPGAIQIPGQTLSWSVDGNGYFSMNGLKQNAASKFAGKCAMSAGTTCTFTLGATYTNYVSFASIDQASAPPATAINAKCAVSGSTVTITAGASNSLTWDCLFIGNPQ